MKDNKGLIIGLLIVLSIGLGYYLITKKEEKADEKKDSDKPTPQPPTPPTGATANSGGGTVPTVNGVARLDPYSGEGETAVKNYAKSLFQSEAGRQVRLANNIGANVFTVTHQNVSPMLKAEILKSAGATDVNGLDLIPSFVDGGEFKRKLETILAYCSDAKNTVNNNGRSAKDGFRQFNDWFRNVCDLTTVGSNFILYPANDFVRDSIIDNSGSKGYGDAGGSESKRFENYVKLLGSELKAIVTALLSALDKYEKAVKNEAINKMILSGWKFIGFN